MNFREYSGSEYDLYEEFARTVREIVCTALHHSDSASRMQATQARAKSPKSLRKKLEMCGLLESDQIEAEIKDLAGCRLIFYTNNDVNGFLDSRLIPDNFEIDWDESKIHQPIDDSDQAYVATHYVVSLSEDRLKLPEYARFRGLKCEIQIQSILNHAWAETSHDIVYKRPTLDGFGSRQFQSIERRMQEIMTEYLMPAGYEFQKIENDFQQLLAGKELFEEGGLAKLESCENNNTRFDTLERFRDFVLPQYDDVVAAFSGIRQQLVDVVSVARRTETIPIETPFGNFKGKNHEQITEVALEILERLRYVNVDEVFSALCEIYIGKKTDSEGERILQAVENLAAHNLEVWKQAGPYVQSRVCERIAALSNEELEPIFPLAVRALSQVLSSEAESTTSTYATVTLHRAAVRPSKELTQVRDTALSILEGMYTRERPEHERRQVLSAMWEATDVPRLGQSIDELDLTVLRDSTRVVRFIATISVGETFEVNQHLEHIASWLYKRYKPWASDESKPERAAASKELVDTILRYKDQLNQNEEFVIYKTLVGFESVFEPEWEDPNFDIRAQTEYRDERINELLESVDVENADIWKQRVIRCAQTESVDGATFPQFTQFLSNLAQKEPNIVLDWLRDIDDRLERFLPSIISGLQKSEAYESVEEMIDRWIGKKLYIDSIARASRLFEDINTDRLVRIAEAAKSIDDVIPLLDVIAIVFQRTTAENADELQALGLDCINYCTEIGENRWIYDAWLYSEDSVFLNELEPNQAEIVLKNLHTVNKIDYHLEALLAEMAKKHPDLVAEFLGKRLRRDRDLEPGSEFDAIPFSFHKLDAVLRDHPDLIVGLSRTLFDEDSTLFEFRGGRMIKIVFSDFSEELETALVDQLRTGGDAGIDFLLNVLRSYEGEVFLHRVVQEIVCALDSNDKRLDLVEIILDSTGVVSGEFGMRQAYQRKKEEVAPWLEDEREKVRLFAERYTRTLDRQIAAEQRRAKEGIEMRKREYGEGTD